MQAAAALKNTAYHATIIRAAW